MHLLASPGLPRAISVLACTTVTLAKPGVSGTSTLSEPPPPPHNLGGAKAPLGGLPGLESGLNAANLSRMPCITPETAFSTGAPSIDSMVDATPDTRDRYVDFLRAASIIVVVLWHWVFSITQWNADGSLGMPNPIAGVPGLWGLTWVLQVMPVFFFVGGYANFASFEAIERSGGNSLEFLKARLRRLTKPVGIYVGTWVIGETIARAAFPTYRGVLQWGFVVFVPLWFLGVYVGVVLATPAMIRLHRKAPILTMVWLAGGIAACELARIGSGVGPCALVGSALVWLFVHQLGFFWRDGTLTRSTRAVWGVIAGGLAGLVVLTNLGLYPRSMVSLQGEGSNILPTTPCIAALAVFQMGLVLAAAPTMRACLKRRALWKATVSLNAVAMTIFCWHMTALVAAIGIYTFFGGSLLTEASQAWWLQRPVWLVLPGVLMLALLRLFARFELPTRELRVPADRVHAAKAG